MMRKNWFIRCTIIAIIAIFLFVCVHVMINKDSVEYTVVVKSQNSDQDTPFQPQEDLIRTIISNESSNINFHINATSSDRENNANSAIVSVVSDVLHDTNVSNTTMGASSDDTVLNERTLERLKCILNCTNRSFEPLIRQRGEYWVLHNFVKAEHGPLECHETVTYTTHGDYTFMDNLVPLLEKYVVSICLLPADTRLSNFF